MGSQVEVALNYSPAPGVIAQFYVDDDAGVFALLEHLSNRAGVSFSAGATPVDLPGGNNAVPPFSADTAFSASADNPAPTNGVGDGEILLLFYDLVAGKTFADVVAAIEDGTLRFGEHIISLPCTATSIDCVGTTSVSIVDVGIPPPPPILVPEPATLAVLGFGLLSFGLMRRRRAAE